MAMTAYMRKVIERTMYNTCYRAAVARLCGNERAGYELGIRDDIRYMYFGLFGMQDMIQVQTSAYNDAFYRFCIDGHRRVVRRYFKLVYSITTAHLEGREADKREARAADAAVWSIARIKSTRYIRRIERGALRAARKDYLIRQARNIGRA